VRDAAAPVQYVRLPGGGASRKGGALLSVARTSCRLWLGDDHLLQVESVGGYSESYKRFYFRDIQAIYLHKTRTWSTQNLVFGSLTGLLLLWALSVKEPGVVVTLGIFSGVFGLLLLVNALRGSTCACHLRTAVHLEELPPLRRRRIAEKVLARLRPLIEAAQGSASAEAVAPQYAALLANAGAMPAVPGQLLRTEPALSAYRSQAHRILFIALLAEAVSGTLNILLPGLPAVFLKIITGGVATCAVLIALVKQHQSDLKLAVRALTWCAGVFEGIRSLAGYVIMVGMAQGQQFDGTQWGYLKAFAQLRPLETPWLLAVQSVSAGVAGLFGASGLLLMRRKPETAA
jgi:hypothetical protein